MLELDYQSSLLDTRCHGMLLIRCASAWHLAGSRAAQAFQLMFLVFTTILLCIFCKA
jgi:hypothetical protein